MVEFKIQVQDGNGNVLGQFEKFRNLKFGKRVNNYGIASFEIPANEPKAESLVALRIYSIWIYRNGTLFWSGEQAIRQGRLDDKGNNWITIYCYTWLEQFISRYTVEEKIFELTDRGQIAWTLIDDTQTESDFGVTMGTIDPTEELTIEYHNQNVFDAIVNLQNTINGFDFEINDLKAFNASSFIGTDRTSLIFEYGYNITSMDITEDFSHPANRAIVLGDSGDPGNSLRVERDDASSQAQYKLREMLTNEMSITDIPVLEVRGDAILRKYGSPLFKTSMNLVRSSFPTIADFALGDIITLKVKNGIYNIEEAFRIYEWSVEYNEDNTERLDLILGNFIIPEFS